MPSHENYKNHLRYVYCTNTEIDNSGLGCGPRELWKHTDADNKVSVNAVSAEGNPLICVWRFFSEDANSEFQKIKYTFEISSITPAEDDMEFYIIDKFGNV